MKIKPIFFLKALLMVAGLAAGIAAFALAYDVVQTDLAREITAVFLEVVITTVLVAALLKFQTDAQVKKHNDAILYQEKFRVYASFLQDFTQALSEADDLQETTVKKLQDSLYQTLLFISNQDNFDLIYESVTNFLIKREVSGLTEVMLSLRNELEPDDNKAEMLQDPNLEKKLDQLFLLIRTTSLKEKPILLKKDQTNVKQVVVENLDDDGDEAENLGFDL